MKKEVPYAIKVEIPYDSDILEDLFLQRFDNIIKNGYTFAMHDYYLFCAILIRLNPLEKLPQIIKDSIIQNGKVKPEILFQKIALAIEKFEKIEKDELDFYFKTKYEEAKRRKDIVKKEIQRTGKNPLKVNINNSVYFRELLNIIKEFSDLTLMDWFVPVVLTFEKYVHIYVKHVEETKISDGQFKNRSFFDYKHTEILTLIKRIISMEEKDIKEHFYKNHIGHETNQKGMIKDYHRGFGKYPPISIGQDIFRLTISKYGFIESFYQIK
jgi:hypothetical protein